MPFGKDTAAGAVDDARPDCWGERVIRVLDKLPRLFLLAYLFYAVDQRHGALVHIIMAGEPVAPRQRRLIEHATMTLICGTV